MALIKFDLGNERGLERTLYKSDQIIEEDNKRLKTPPEYLDAEFSDKSFYLTLPHISAAQEFIRRYIENFNLPKREAVLYAHGTYTSGGLFNFSKKSKSWVYASEANESRENRFGNVQDWVDEKDGSEGVLYLGVCNPGHLDVTSRSSLIIYPDSILSSHRMVTGKCKTKIYAPEMGLFGINDIEEKLQILEGKRTAAA
ncbi:MAG: hypothetical protein AABW51_03050 [Nanoarchaeota archaeon]